MAARTNYPEKPTAIISFRATDTQVKALHELADLRGISAGQLLRLLLEDEWSDRAEDLKKFRDVVDPVRKKKRAA